MTDTTETLRARAELDDKRLLAIEQRANAGEYHCREHWGQFDADDDVLFLLAVIARFRGDTKAASQRADTAELERDSLRLERDAIESNRIRDNAHLLARADTAEQERDTEKRRRELAEDDRDRLLTGKTLRRVLEAEQHAAALEARVEELDRAYAEESARTAEWAKRHDILEAVLAYVESKLSAAESRLRELEGHP